jgi:Hemerythrin HHE cation binding domain
VNAAAVSPTGIPPLTPRQAAAADDRTVDIRARPDPPAAGNGRSVVGVSLCSREGFPRMTVWQLIAHDHAFLAHLIAEIRSAGDVPNRDREAVLGGLIDELAAHAEALEASLYAPLRALDRTRQLAEDLHREHARFIRQLDALARLRRGDGGRGALDVALIGQHVRRYTQELIPAARELLSPAQVDAAAHAFLRAKMRALRARQLRGSGRLTVGKIARTCAVCVAAAGLGYLAGRSASARRRFQGGETSGTGPRPAPSRPRG